MSNLIEIQGQIEKLQKQASEIRVREFDKTVQEILVKMNVFGITLKHIQTVKARNIRGKTKTAAKPESVGSKVKRKSGKAEKLLRLCPLNTVVLMAKHGVDED